MKQDDLVALGWHRERSRRGTSRRGVVEDRIAGALAIFMTVAFAISTLTQLLD
jgi:hypothetical protein